MGASQGVALAVSWLVVLAQLRVKAPKEKVASRAGVKAGSATLASRVMVVLDAMGQEAAPVPTERVRRPRVQGVGRM